MRRLGLGRGNCVVGRWHILKRAGVLLVATLITSGMVSARSSEELSRKRRGGRESSYEGMPGTDEIFGWIKDIWKFGADGKYGYRMPGTPADHKAVEYILNKFREFGIEDAEKELVPIPGSFPETSRLQIKADGKTEEIACSFVHYAATTPTEGITADIVYVGKGSQKEFEAADNSTGVAGKIVLVDIVSAKISWKSWFKEPLFVYDPDKTLSETNYFENWPFWNFGDAIRRADQYGAVGLVAILTGTRKDNSTYYHGPRHDAVLMPCVSVSPAAGEKLRAIARSNKAEATIVVTETEDEPRLKRGNFHGKWGVTYNVNGFLPGRSEEVIVVMSHHDGGANNEASGTFVVMALAKYFAGLPRSSRDRSLLFFLIGSHFGKRPPTLDQARRLDGLKEKVVCVINIEMIGKDYKLVDGRYVDTGLIGPTSFSVSDKNPRLVKIVSEAIKKHDLRRSTVNDHFVGEGRIMSVKIGFPTIERFAMNAPQLNLDDTPETVAKDALRPTACAFVDIISGLNKLPRDQIGNSPFKTTDSRE